MTLAEELMHLLLEVHERVTRTQRVVMDLARGHNALVRLIINEGDRMSAVSDAILAEDTKAVALIQSVQDLINKLNNGNNTLDAETQAALAQVDGHLNTVTQEVADASGGTPAPTSQPFEGGPDAGTVGV
jgi:division protein CdvB (Snf7/Vps24/ESCRT-III family)